MAGPNYAPLIAEWPNLTGTTAQKLATLNAMTVSNVPNATWRATARQVWECIVLAEFMALTQPNRMEVYAHLGMGFDLIGGATAPTGILAAVPFFGSGTCPLTYANLVALAQSVAGSSPWWQVNGFTAPITNQDLINAGGLT